MPYHLQLVERIRAAQPDVVFIGDSIIANWQVVGFGKPSWDTYFAPLKAFNLGITSDRTQNVLWRVEHGELDRISPKVAVLMIGGNNLPFWSADDIAHGITTIVIHIRRKLPHTRILLLGIFPFTDQDILRQKVVAVNIILAHSHLGPEVHYLDIGAVLLAANGRFLPGVMTEGGIHPSTQGYALLTQALYPQLLSLLK